MKTLKCPYCNETWGYKGLKNVFVNCPDCRKPVHVIKNKIKEVTVNNTSTTLNSNNPPLVSKKEVF